MANLSRRTLLKLMGAGALGTVTRSVVEATAAGYPTKPVEMVIPWPPGGRTDLAVRTMAPYLEKYLGQPVVVINKVGGAGIIGMTYARDAKPDGYTISSGGMALSLFQYQKPSGLSLWDYTWIARTYWTPMVVAVNAQSPAKTLKDLVDQAKAAPNKLRHGNSGTGSTTHLASAAFAKKFGLKFTQVPYKGEGPAVIGLGSSEVDFAFGLMVAFRALVDAGKLRILAVADTSRDRNYPGVPTSAEQGYEFTAPAWEAIHTPKGLPKPVLAALADACRRALSDGELKEKFAKMGLHLSYQPGPEFTEWLRTWDKDVKDLIFELGLNYKA